MRTGRAASALALTSVIALALLQVALFIDRYPQLSPVDELQHADYMIKASRGELLRRGDTIGPEAAREAACRGIVEADRVVPDCMTNPERPPWLAEQTGVNTEEIQPPAYYLITGLLARALQSTLDIPSMVTAGRWVGGLWLAAGVAVLWALLGRVRAHLVTRWGVTALVACSPQMLGVAAVINNDVTALVAGSAVLLAAAAREQRALHGGVVLAIVVVAISVKPTNVVGVGVAAGYLAIRALFPRPGAARRPAMLRMAATMVGVAALTGLLFLALHAAIARAGPLVNPNTARFQTDHLTLERAVRALPNGVTPVKDPFLPPFLATIPVRAVIHAGDWLLLGAAVGAIAAGLRRRNPAWPLAVSGLATCTFAGPAYVILNYVASDIYFNIPPRYALSAVPGLAVVLAAVLRRSLMRRAVAGIAALGSCIVLLTLALA